MVLKEEGNRLFKVTYSISVQVKIPERNLTLFHSGGRCEGREERVLAEPVDVPTATGGLRKRQRILGHPGQQGMGEFWHQRFALTGVPDETK